MASPPFKVKAVYEYASPHEEDLSFPQGQIITVTEEEDADWYVGEYTDGSGNAKSGLFPKNFVEKFEPTAPPRPVRSARPKQAEAPMPKQEPVREIVPEPQAPTAEPEDEDDEPNAPAERVHPPAAVRSPPTSPPIAASTQPVQRQPEPPVASKPAPAAANTEPAASKAAPPEAAPKPSSFRDRIAAFNKPAAPPVAPKPSIPGSSTFIKKPFVAPPPSRNAYIPPVTKEPPPQKVYRREEDPEIAERVQEEQDNAERAGLAGAAPAEEGEDAAKPTSLKERIAMLQKQQMEQAARRADTAHKEKPKKPTKKRTESHERSIPVAAEGEEVDYEPPVEDYRDSSDAPRDVARPPQPRKQSQPRVPAAQREIFSDANDADQSNAGETTEDAEGASTSVEEEEDRPRAREPALPIRAPTAPTKEPEVGDEEDDAEEDEDEEEDEMDEEERRKLELRQRMAKMSGGMGMAGMFGPPGGMPMPGAGAPKKRKPAASSERKPKEEDDIASEPAGAHQRMPMIPVPGMPHPIRSPESEDTQLAVEKGDDTPHPITGQRPADEIPDVEDVKPEASPRAEGAERAVPPRPPQQGRAVPPPPPGTARAAPPPVPGDRPNVPLESRPVPPPVDIASPTPGSEADDEFARPSRQPSGREMPYPIPGAVPYHGQSPTSPQSPQAKRSSTMGSDKMSLDSPTAPSEKRTSRVPPVPQGMPAMPPMSPDPSQGRPPPPPPPTAAPPSRQPTIDNLPTRSGMGEAEEETEYEGDYDTDIASGTSHKDALKAHAREASNDDSTPTEEAPVRSPPMPTSAAPPPVPHAAGTTTRAVPPPPPPGQPPSRRSTDFSRKSMDAPRVAPPPVPPPRDGTAGPEDDEYDPYRYTGGSSAPRAPPPSMPAMPPPPPSRHVEEEEEDEDLYEAPAPPPPTRKSTDRAPPPLPPQAPPHQERAVPTPTMLGYEDAPQPPPHAAPPSAAPSSRKSLDVNRQLSQGGRRSMDAARPSGQHDHIAQDVDLAEGSQWWTHQNTPPPVFQNRPDVLYEMEESTTAKRGGKTMVSRDVYVLFIDYSQTVITARFDANSPADVSLEQRHEPPPARLRQDQLEAAHAQFGQRIAQDSESKQNTTVGDGTPQALILELLKPHTSVLKPIGTRAYGALVYANLANASVQQFDEIRPGDIISLRNAKFEGKHGGLHQKYKMEAGKPDHVGVVVDWDGTKKKIRAWEQGRESRKVKMESFRVGDLRSGEVRVWRVMPRGWVGWE